MLKRTFDLLCSALTLLVLSPMMLAIAILIKLSDRGPVFYRGLRTGRFGRPFRVYKFRTMVLGAEARQAELESCNEMTGPVFKMRDDPRVTRIGRFLRRFSLDAIRRATRRAAQFVP